MESVLLRDELLFLVKLAEMGEKYEDMVLYMHSLIREDSTLNKSERELLAVAYKNTIGPNRIAWRTICAFEIREEPKPHMTPYMNFLRDYKLRIESEIAKTCDDLTSLLEEKLIPAASENPEALVFYNKLRGDYYRYLAEVSSDQKLSTAIASASQSYLLAHEGAADCLLAVDTLKLGVALNYAVFFFEVCDQPAKAIAIAREAYDQASSDREILELPLYRSSWAVWLVLRENINLWQSEVDEVMERQRIENMMKSVGDVGG